MNVNMNRIPVNVDMNAESGSSQQQQKFNSSSEFRSSSSSNMNKASSENTYNMRTMNDETERIRERMREFEEHCRRVREQAFANRPLSTSNMVGGASGGTSGGSFFNDFDQRVPSSSTAGGFEGGSRLGSSMHRSSIEDLPDGSKKYRIEFDIGDFNQNELYIGTNGKTLVVKGDRELKAGSATETKTFNREMTLPDYVDVNRMNAFLLNNVTPAPASPGTSSSR